jgi:tryptophan synthase alpha chain
MDSDKQDLLNIYFTAGFPKLNSALKIIKILDKAGVDIIELGIPYSDPLADGPVIQASGQQALDNGMSLSKLFADLSGLREQSNIPVLLMGYLNSIMNYDLNSFCKSCIECGIDGLILPDLPFDIYEKEFKQAFEKANLSVIFLITPQTSKDRLQQFDEASTAFIYAVSSSSTTGSKENIDDSEEFLKRIQKMNLKSPVLTGFNIRNAESFNMACQYTRGGIIGSSFIKSIEKSENLEFDIQTFINSIRIK